MLSWTHLWHLLELYWFYVTSVIFPGCLQSQCCLLCLSLPSPPLQCSPISLHLSPFIHSLTPFLVVNIQHPTLPYPWSPGGSPWRCHSFHLNPPSIDRFCKNTTLTNYQAWKYEKKWWRIYRAQKSSIENTKHWDTVQWMIYIYMFFYWGFPWSLSLSPFYHSIFVT